MASNLPHLADESYISLETFRKDGSGVKTPVWAAPLDGHLVIFSEATAYKVKRLRNDPKIRAAACDVRGKVRGDWFDGTAEILEDKDRIEQARRALRSKYGFIGAVTDFLSRITGRINKRAYLEVTFTS